MSNSKSSSLPPAHELEQVAQRASTTVPTVRNYLRGKPGKPRIAARVKAALAELGLTPALVAHAEPTASSTQVVAPFNEK